MNSQRSPNNCRSFNFSPCLSSTSASRWKKRENPDWTPALRCFAHWQSGRPPRGLKCQASCHSHIPAHLCLPVISAIGNRLRHPQRPSASLHQLTRGTGGCRVFACYIGDVTFNSSSSNGETSGAINWAWKATRDVWAGLYVHSVPLLESRWHESEVTRWAVWGNTVQNEARTGCLIGLFFFFCLCCSLSGVESSLIWLITASPIRR